MTTQLLIPTSCCPPCVSCGGGAAAATAGQSPLNYAKARNLTSLMTGAPQMGSLCRSYRACPRGNFW
jgi:hypothetical protein